MKYKALILDYDGTTAAYSYKELPQLPNDKVTLSLKAAEQHLSVVFATSRPLSHMKPILSHLNINGYAILASGAQIIDSLTQKTLWKQPLDPRVIPTLLQLVNKYHLEAYWNDFVERHHVSGDLLSNSSEMAYMYLTNIPLKYQKIIESKLKQLSTIAIHKFHSPKHGMSEIIVSDILATKQHAIVHVAKLLKIDTKAMIGVGDNHNDFPLLMACGLKIAMGNAVDDLKAIADFVAPSVDEDGVATVIDKFILS